MKNFELVAGNEKCVNFVKINGTTALAKRGNDCRHRIGEGGEYGQGGKRRYKFTRGCEHSVAKEEQEGEQISYHEGRN